MKRLKKLLLILVVLQVVNTALGMVLNWRFLSQKVGDGEINVVGVSGKADEKVTSTNFKGGFLRAVMGGVKLDLTEATVVDRPATIEVTVVMGGAEITVPEGWKVKVDTRNKLAGVNNALVNGVSDDGEVPDLVLIGKVLMGGVVIRHHKADMLAEQPKST